MDAGATVPHSIGAPSAAAAAAWNLSQADEIGATTSFIEFLGREIDCDPLPHHTSRRVSKELSSWLSPEVLDLAVVTRHRPRLWCDVRERESLQVTVFGGSVTAGCGAEAPLARCDTRWSWTRHLRDRLGDMLRHAGRGEMKLDVRTWGKNAVDSSYFMQCTRSRFQLSSNTSVVLIELESAYQAGSIEAIHMLKVLLARIHRAAPHAAIGFVAWPSMLFNPRAIEERLLNMSALDVTLVTPLMSVAAQRANLTRDRFYAENVHPGPTGHALLGHAAAYMIAKGILGAHNKTCDNHAAASSHLRKHSPTTTSSPLAVDEAELCIGSADQLPVVKPLDGWALRDEGGKKGVQKLGYVSTTVGTTLTLGPLLPNIKCGLYDASFGFLQSWRPEMGALHLKCVGCQCGMIPGAWASAAYPFPNVQAWSYGQRISSKKEFTKAYAATANASLTVSTRFMLLKQESDCFLNVTHIPGASRGFSATGLRDNNANRTRSRVRVDSIGFETASCTLFCHVSHFPSTKALSTRGRACAAGMERGERGFVAPPCFTNGTTRCANAMEKDRKYVSEEEEQNAVL